MSREPILIDLDPDSERAFVQAVGFIFDELNWGAPAILRNAGVSYVRAGRNSTKKARKNAKRKIVKGPRHAETSRRGTTNYSGRWSAIVLSQDRRPRAVPIKDPTARTIADAKRTDLAAVPNVGAAKGSWWGVLRDLDKIGRKDGPDVGRAVMESKAAETSLTIINRLKYLLKINPDVDREAKRKAAKDIVLKVESLLDRTYGSIG